MSNVSLVSICKSVQTALIGVGEGIGAVCVGTANAIRWLTEETPEDRAAVEMLKEVRRQERLNTASNSGIIMSQGIHPLRSVSTGISTRVSESISRSSEKLVIASSRTPVRANAESLEITTASLHLRDTESLVRSAEKLGYKVATPAVSNADGVLLARATGERLALGRDASGSVVVQTAGQQERIQALVRQHTLDRATEHLKSRGMSLQTAALANGEVQIIAQEKNARKRGGAAELKTQIRADGTVLVDVDKVKGNRCEGMVRDLADAVGGEVSLMKKKDSFFQLPGEPAKAKVKL